MFGGFQTPHQLWFVRLRLREVHGWCMTKGTSAWPCRLARKFAWCFLPVISKPVGQVWQPAQTQDVSRRVRFCSLWRNVSLAKESSVCWRTDEQTPAKAGPGVDLPVVNRTFLCGQNMPRSWSLPKGTSSRRNFCPGLFSVANSFTCSQVNMHRKVENLDFLAVFHADNRWNADMFLFVETKLTCKLVQTKVDAIKLCAPIAEPWRRRVGTFAAGTNWIWKEWACALGILLIQNSQFESGPHSVWGPSTKIPNTLFQRFCSRTSCKQAIASPEKKNDVHLGQTTLSIPSFRTKRFCVRGVVFWTHWSQRLKCIDCVSRLLIQTVLTAEITR